MLKNLLLIFILIFSAGKLCPQWTQITSSPSGYFYDIIIINDTLYAAHSSSGVYRSTDSTFSWELVSNGLNTIQAKSVNELLADGTSLYAATTDGIYKSTNAGESWIKKSSGMTIGPGALYEFAEAILKYNDELFAGAWNGIYRSTDNAESWEITNVSGFGVGPGFFVNHDGTLFAARENINFPFGYKSTDDGISWQELSSISVPAITFFSEPPELWAGTIHGIWLSNDDGLNWEYRGNGLPPDPYNSSIIRVNGKLISSVKFGGSGIYRSSDEGMNWEDWSDGLSFLSSIEKLIVFHNQIIAATSNGLWSRDTSGTITETSFIGNSLPENFILYQNYPNPFNPTTKIKFTIPTPPSSSPLAKGRTEVGFVNLIVYDVLGNEVATLVDEEKTTGTYEIEFSAYDMPGGVYLYKLQAGNFVEIKKMILLK